MLHPEIKPDRVIPLWVIKPLCGPPLWTFGDVCPGFKAKVVTYFITVRNGLIRHNFPVQHLPGTGQLAWQPNTHTHILFEAVVGSIPLLTVTGTLTD